MIFAGDSLATGTTPAGPRISLAVWAQAPHLQKANAIVLPAGRWLWISE
jgi:hypothetical protein